MPLNAIKYTNTIIYKIVCNDINIKDLYVGHTTDFKSRKRVHKYTCNTISDDKRFNIKLYKVIRENGGWENWSMIEVEKYSCNDSYEAKAKERYWIEKLKASLNTTTPNRTKEEMKIIYKEIKLKNKDKIKEQMKIYKEVNKDKIKEQMKLYRELNKDKIYENKKEYMKTHSDKVKEWKRQYREKHKDEINQKQRDKRISKSTTTDNKDK